jgi:hypothetical protein
MAKNRSAKTNPKKPKPRAARGPSRRDLRSRFTRRDRDEVLREIEARFRAEELEGPAEFEAFFECLAPPPPFINAEPTSDFEEVVQLVYLWWGLFDFPYTDEGQPLAELELQRTDLPPGHRAFLEAAKSARMRLYDVVAVASGRSVTLRDLFSDAPPVQVRARAESQSLQPGELIATRVFCGPSGRLEMDGGTLRYSEEHRPHVLDAIERHLEFYDEVEPEADDDARWSTMPPLLYQLLRDDPALEPSDLAGNEPPSIHIIFRVLDVGAVSERLDADERSVGLLEAPSTWHWIDPEISRDVGEDSLHLQVDDARLILHTYSFESADAGRKAVEALLDGLIECDHYEITIPRALLEGAERAALN